MRTFSSTMVYYQDVTVQVPDDAGHELIEQALASKAEEMRNIPGEVRGPMFIEDDRYDEVL